MKVIVTASVAHLCPYRDEVDNGTAEITFVVPEGDAPELHDMAEALGELATMRLSHEEVTRAILVSFPAERVVTRWKTASMDVTCDLSRESDR